MNPICLLGGPGGDMVHPCAARPSYFELQYAEYEPISAAHLAMPFNVIPAPTIQHKTAYFKQIASQPDTYLFIGLDDARRAKYLCAAAAADYEIKFDVNGTPMVRLDNWWWKWRPTEDGNHTMRLLLDGNLPYPIRRPPHFKDYFQAVFDIAVEVGAMKKYRRNNNQPRKQ